MSSKVEYFKKNSLPSQTFSPLFSVLQLLFLFVHQDSKSVAGKCLQIDVFNL